MWAALYVFTVCFVALTLFAAVHELENRPLAGIHDTEAFQNGSDGPKAAFRWSGDEAEARRLQEEHAHHYLRWTFVGAFAVMIVGVIGVSLSFFDLHGQVRAARWLRRP